MEPNTSLLSKKAGNSQKNGTPKTWLNGQIMKVTKITLRSSSLKKSQVKLSSPWIKNTWKTFWVLSMLKSSRDSWSSSNNLTLRVNKIAKFTDGAETINHNLEPTLQTQCQTLTKSCFQKASNCSCATTTLHWCTIRKKEWSAWVQRSKASWYGSQCSKTCTAFGRWALHEITLRCYARWQRTRFHRTWVKGQCIRRKRSWGLQRT